MAKVKIGAITRFKNAKKKFQDKKYMNRLAIYARDLIYKRVKDGYGVTNDTSKDPKKKKLKPLSDSYISFREGSVRFYTSVYGHVYPVTKGITAPTLGPFGRPGFSNLTFSGEMLESMEFKVSNNSITMRIPNSRRSDGKTNKEVAGYVRKERPFFALTDVEKKLVLREWKQIVQTVLNSK